MVDVIKKVQLLSKTEVLLLKIHLRTAVKQTLLYAVGILMVLLAAAMLNVAIYVAIEETYSALSAALSLCFGNGLLAAALFAIAGRLKPGPELAMAEEVRDLTMSELYADAENVKTDIENIRSGVVEVRSGIRSFFSGAFYLRQLVEMLTSLFKKEQAE